MNASASPPDAYVFDAYGTLFDVYALAATAESVVPGHGAALTNLWRTKQLEYSWLTSLMGRRTDFMTITEQALDYAQAALVVPLAAGERARLLSAWLSLPAFPDAAATLARLAPKPRWILSNGAQAMLAPLVAGSALAGMLDGILSVDEVGVFKPSPRVYALACERLGLPAPSIAFVSANGWDAAGAKARGFRTFWINRTGFPIECHADAPDHVVGSLAEVAAIALG
jgi:2-haloacid dehalogenase